MSMGNLIKGNPILQRYRYSVMRPRQFWIYTAVYLIIVFLFFFINLGSDAPLETYFTEVLIFQVVILWVWAAHNSSSAIKEELSEKTYDFFRLLPLSAHQKATGILIGRNLAALLFAGINLGLLILFALGFMGIFQLVQLILLMVLGGFCINAISLLSSLRMESRKSRSSNLFLLVLLFFLITPLLGSIMALSESGWGQSSYAVFYGLKVPLILFIALVALYLGIWAYVGIIRKFLKENECMFTREGAVLFLVGSGAILMGLFLPHLYDRGRLEINYIFWMLSLLPLVFISLSSIRMFDDYWNKSQKANGITKLVFMKKMFLFSNTALAVLLFAIWAVFSTISAIRTEMNSLQCAGMIAILFFSYLFLVLLIEVWALYKPDSDKIGVLLVVIYAVYFILPMICAGMFDHQSLMAGSPMGLFLYLNEVVYLSTAGMVVLLVYQMGLCVIPAMKVWQQWKKIKEARELVDRGVVA